MNVNFQLPGLFSNYHLNMIIIGLYEKLPEYFREGFTIESLYGEFPVSLWNGGRESPVQYMCDKNSIKEIVNMLNEKGISVRYTFTNMFISEKDLEDEYCNYCLQVANNEMNAVILTSPILEKYIRTKYPKIKIISSTCKCLNQINALTEELLQNYFLVVIDYHINNQFNELKKIQQKDHCEILVNSTCHPDCNLNHHHYETIAKNQKIIFQNLNLPQDKKENLKIFKCPFLNQLPSDIQKYSTYIKPEDIWNKYVPLGFSHFKIAGRTTNIFYVVEDYCKYFFKPEYQDNARMLIYQNLKKQNIISVHLP